MRASDLILGFLFLPLFEATPDFLCKSLSDGQKSEELIARCSWVWDSTSPTIVDNDVLYFASDGHPRFGALDIFKTKNENGPWTTHENLYPPINSSFDDFAIAFVPGKKMVFSHLINP